MGFIDCASAESAWRGYHYFNDKKVLSVDEITPGIYAAKVSGSSQEPYEVDLDINHVRRSKCNCPHANGRRIVCKHIVAAYFTVLPHEAERFYNDAMAQIEQQETINEELENRFIKFVGKMKKGELQQALLQTLFEGPEWQYTRFIRENGLDEY